MFIWIKHLFLHNTVRYQHGEPWRQLMKLKQGFLPVNRNTEDTSSLSKHVLLCPFFHPSCDTRNKQGSSHAACRWLLDWAFSSLYLESQTLWQLSETDNRHEMLEILHWSLLYYGDIDGNVECLKSGKLIELEDCKTVSNS